MDGQASDRFVPCLNLFSLWGLPDYSTGPEMDAPDLLTKLKAAGYAAIQGLSSEGAAAAGMAAFGVARLTEPHEADAIARTQRDAGFAATTLIAGHGLEADGDVDGLCAAIVEPAERYGHPLLIETHRASMTQNIRRTIDAIYRFPELRFTADLSPWYVGHDLPSGDFDAKAAFLSPFFERVRLIQGRIGTPTCMQVNLTGADDARPFVDDYRRLWRECFFGFLAHADPAEEIAFAPELLPWIADFNGIAQHLYFAPTQRNAEGLEIETGDRWQQAGYLVDIGRTVFAEVCSRT